MADAHPAAIALAAASQSLRDTAKWLTGGMAATAAGVFAGSSLTSLGSLDLTTDRWRVVAAGVGFLIGFVGLGASLAAAIFVMMRESVTFDDIASGRTWELRKAGNKVYGRYKGDLNGAKSLTEYSKMFDAAYHEINRDTEQTAIVKGGEEIIQIVCADANFCVVKNRFQILLFVLALGTILEIVGFGTFSWAANPPKRTVQAQPLLTMPAVSCK